MFSKKTILELYKTLPKELKEILDSDATTEKIETIAQEADLSIDQEIIVADLIHYVFLGLINPNDFEKTLKKELKIKKQEKINQIMVLVHRLFFFPFKKQLEALYSTKIVPNKEVIKKPIKKDIYREPIE